MDATALKVGQSLVVDAYGDNEDDSLAVKIRIVPPIRAEDDTRADPFCLALLAVLVGAVFQDVALAHGVTGRDAAFVQSIDGPAIGPFMYLGAKHMVTGYDHLLFLVGVIFFLYRLKDVVLYVSLFTIGHSMTLLAGVLGGIHANAYIVDAIIGLSVVYKALREHRRLRARARLPAEHAGGGAVLRLLPRLRSGDEAAGVRAVAERARHEHRQLQRRRRDRPDAGADGRADRVQLLAHAARVSCASVRRERASS